MLAAICATAIACVAYARGQTWLRLVRKSGGGSPMDAHRGQSRLGALAGVLSSPETSSFMVPALLHTISMDCGCTHGEAIATPTDSTNQASTRRASRLAWRRVCRVTQALGACGWLTALACGPYRRVGAHPCRHRHRVPFETRELSIPFCFQRLWRL